MKFLVLFACLIGVLAEDHTQTCHNIGVAVCLVESGDIQAAVKAICNGVIDNIPQAAGVCEKIEDGTLDAAKVTAVILDELNIAFHCPQYQCRPNQNETTLQAVDKSGVSVCKGAEAKLCCQACQYFVGKAEAVITNKQDEALAKKQLDELCKQMEKNPIQRGVVGGSYIA